MIDDQFRVACIATHEDESKEIAHAVPRNAVAWFAEGGVTVQQDLTERRRPPVLPRARDRARGRLTLPRTQLAKPSRDSTPRGPLLAANPEEYRRVEVAHMTFVSILDPALDPVVTTPAGDDWTPVFADAIATAVTDGHAGVFVPARSAPYTVMKPAAAFTPSIDLRGLHDFVLVGEGPRSVIAMLGQGSWKLLHIGNEATDVVVRDLCFDGARVPKDDQAHLIVIGASANLHRGAQRISVLNCTLRNAPADGVALVPWSSSDRRDEVSDITIAGCHFIGNRRTGVSNQRLAKRVSILHNRFERTHDQDIDFEPSGDLPDSGPSGYLILGNTMVRSHLSVSVTLSGTTPEARSRVNTFAYNQILGGGLGVHDAQDLAIIGNHIETGPKVKGTVVRLGGAIERVLFADNSVVRPRNAPRGTLMSLSSEPTDYAFSAADPSVPPAIDPATDTFTRKGHRLQTGAGPLRASVVPPDTLPGGLDPDEDYWAIRVDEDHFRIATSPPDAVNGIAVDVINKGTGTLHLIRHGFPRTVSIARNRFSTFRPLPGGEALITIANASTVSFRDNDVASYAGVTLPIAVKFESRHDVHKRPISCWEVVGNRFRGNANLPPEFDQPGAGKFGACLSMSAGKDVVSDVRVLDNAFAGCDNQVKLSAEGTGDFVRAPQVAGNIGDGISLDLSGVRAVLVSGNLQSAPAGPGTAPLGARYCGRRAPDFVAPVGSLYSRIDAASTLLYINVDGNATWKGLALVP